MPTRLVCLANSFKEGGRCLAGIQNESALRVWRPCPVCAGAAQRRSDEKEDRYDGSSRSDVVWACRGML